MSKIRQLNLNLLRRGRRLCLVASGIALCLSTNQRLMAQSHDMHQHHHDSSAATEATANDVPLSHLSIPDVVLLNQRGERVHFYTDLVKGKVVAINFIFTTCTTICPPMGANFSKLQQLMSNHVGRDFNLLSISVDPVTDTPPRLKAWSEKFAAGPGWTLLTGPKSDVDYLLKALKVFTPDKWDHSPIVLVGNEATGQWTRVYGLAPPTKLAEMVTGLIDSTAKRSSPKETSQ